MISILILFNIFFVGFAYGAHYNRHIGFKIECNYFCGNADVDYTIKLDNDNTLFIKLVPSQMKQMAEMGEWSCKINSCDDPWRNFLGIQRLISRLYYLPIKLYWKMHGINIYGIYKVSFLSKEKANEHYLAAKTKYGKWRVWKDWK